MSPAVGLGRYYATLGADMKRREFITFLGSVAPACQLEASAQSKIPRIGFMGNSTAALEANLVDAFREGARSKESDDNCAAHHGRGRRPGRHRPCAKPRATRGQSHWIKFDRARPRGQTTCASA